MGEKDTKLQLPNHVVLGNGEYARSKTANKPLIFKEGESVAAKTKLRWMILSLEIELEKANMLLSQTSQIDFDKLCVLTS